MAPWSSAAPKPARLKLSCMIRTGRSCDPACQAGLGVTLCAYHARRLMRCLLSHMLHTVPSLACCPLSAHIVN